MPTVTIERIQGHRNALLMTWQHDVDKDDVGPAFQEITDFLNVAPDQVYVVVDLLQNPRFPMVETMRRALAGPYDHPKMQAWLVVGSNRLARQIENFLSTVTGKKNVYWFDTIDEAMTHLQQQTGR
ncbi:MAG: hypothetical protein L0154_03285 [Chloroflexi bacterium]|nr:hypothetical protein [Chloroflexota bacterium]